MTGDSCFLSVVNQAAASLTEGEIAIPRWTSLRAASHQVGRPSPAFDWRSPYMALMASLRRSREATGMSQKAMADRLGVHMRTLRRWENGEGDPPAQMLFRWAALVGVTVGANLPHRPGTLEGVHPDPSTTQPVAGT